MGIGIIRRKKIDKNIHNKLSALSNAEKERIEKV